MPAPTIPRFALYGEAADPPQPAFVHIETIVARSARNAWEIKPHSHSDFVQLLLIQTGGVTALLDGDADNLGAPSIIVVPAFAVHGFTFLPDTRGVVLTLSRDFLSRDSQMLPRFWDQRVHSACPLALARRIARLAIEMLRVQADASGGGDALLLALAEAIVRLAGQSFDMAAALAPVPAAERLRALMDAHFREHRPLAFYARAMAMTERTLSRLCRTNFGCAPQTLLHRRLTTEATRLLLYSNAQVAQIADELGFAEPSYFSRFYLRMTGQRPAEARLQRAVTARS